uniref:Coiled-coil domain-containing protein 22 homolog n=1 Tax=Acrobeloides nanus TaxID=290746 RepID=A0A914CAC8_9BILA
MEDVDRIIIESLAKLECSFCVDSIPESLLFLSQDDIVESIIKCLWACDSENKELIPSYKLPTHMTNKYKVATTIANAIKNLGIREEVGYHTLLYQNIFEIRRILLGLIERLPKEAIINETNLSPLEQLKLKVGTSIARHLKEPWVPEFCRYLKMKYDGRFWHSKADEAEFIAFFSKYEGSKFSGRHEICSILEGVANEGVFEENLDFTKLKIEEKLLRPSLPPKPMLKPKPPIPTKPKKLPPIPQLEPREYEKLVTATAQENHENHVEERNLLKNEIESIASQISMKHSVLEVKKREIIEMRYAQVRLEDDISRQKDILENADDRIMTLLETPEEGVEKLQKFIQESDNRRIEFQEKFLAAKNSKNEELAVLRSKFGVQENRESQITIVREMQQRIEEHQKLIDQKTRTLAKLEKESRKILNSPQIDRSKYVKRIMEIVANVNKQKEDILKVVDSIRKIEKEINYLNGNLDRTLTVVDRWLSKAVEKDVIMQKAHKLLLRLHEQCGLVITAIKEKGQISRQIDELTDEIELESQKSVDTQLERLLNDLMQMRQENLELSESMLQK